MASTLTLTTLKQDFGDYYLNSGQNASRLIKDLTQAPETLNIPGIRHIPTKETIYQMSNPEMGEILQPYQEAFTSKGNSTFHPNEIRLRQAKVDYEIYPERIEESWLGFLGGDASRNIENWPIVRYLMEELIAPQVADDKETKVVYSGKYAAPTSGTAGNASATMDGFKELLKAGAASTNNYPIHKISSIGALNTSTAYAQITSFANAIGHKYRSQRLPIIIFVAPEFEMAFLKKKFETRQYTVANDWQIDNRVDFTNIIVKGVASMIGTTDMWATIPSNIIHLTKRNADISNFDIQKDGRKVMLLMDWYEAIGFGCNQLVWATDETVATTTSGSAQQ